MNNSRRKYIQLLSKIGIGVGLMPLTSVIGKTKPVKPKKKIAIIGSGISGLSAAQALQQAGYDVIVIEARDSIGGRIQTSNHWADLPVDLGASWIHGVKGNPITKLAKEIQAKTIETKYDNVNLVIAKQLRDAGIDSDQNNQMSRLVNRALKRAQNQPKDLSVWDAVQLERKISDMSDAQNAQLDFYLNSTFEQEYAGEVTRLSAKTIDDNDELEGGDVLFEKGYSQIINEMANHLNIVKSQAVTKIEYQDQGVTISTPSKTFYVDFAVITIPLGVLKAKNIKFSPELPIQKSQAIERLGFGLLDKLYLRFDHVFWDKKYDWHEYMSAQKGFWSEWVSFAKIKDTPVLLGFNAANRAHELEKWTDQQLIQNAMIALRDMFGHQIPEPIDHQITRWAQDPYALGSYSFNAVGSTNQHRVELGKAVQNKLFWCGEATHANYPGTVHGAYLSAKRVVKEIKAIT